MSSLQVKDLYTCIIGRFCEIFNFVAWMEAWRQLVTMVHEEISCLGKRRYDELPGPVCLGKKEMTWTSGPGAGILLNGTSSCTCMHFTGSLLLLWGQRRGDEQQPFRVETGGRWKCRLYILDILTLLHSCSVPDHWIFRAHICCAIVGFCCGCQQEIICLSWSLICLVREK